MSLNALSLSLNSLKRSLSLCRKEVLKSVPTGSKRIKRAFKFVEFVRRKNERGLLILFFVSSETLSPFLFKIGLRSKNEKSLLSAGGFFVSLSLKKMVGVLFRVIHAFSGLKKREKFIFCKNPVF